MSATIAAPRYDTEAYRQAYGRINGLVIVGEGLADHHFRRLAALLPRDGAELLRLGAMEARHARDFVGCGRNLGVRPDLPLARRLLAPLRRQFQEAHAAGDTVRCLVIQCLIIECFAVAAYRCYLPVADPYARPITALVLADEAHHLNYGAQWLRERAAAVAPAVEACVVRVLPLALAMLSELSPDLGAIGIDPVELLAELQLGFEESLRAIGFAPAHTRRLLARLLARIP